MSGIEDLRHDALSLVVVDDAPTGRTYLLQALRRAGYADVRIAESAEQALDVLGERAADVVLADWVMPGMDGLELTARIREEDEEHGRYTAIILCTAREGIDTLVRAFRHGVDDFLHKPFDAEELIARIFAVGTHAQAQNLLIESSGNLARRAERRGGHWAHDPATGLGNETWFEAQLSTHVLEAGMRGGAVCCALIDVTGPAMADTRRDAALERIGRRLMRAVRPTDAVCRVGDQRFGLAMAAPEPDAFRAPLFERIERSVAGRPVLSTRRRSPDIEVRSGYAIWRGPGPGISPVELQARAERHLGAP
jgi:PleD family two-component response regulator